MESSLELLIRRSALPQAPVAPDLVDLLRFADLCLAEGQEPAARMLCEAAFVAHGFSPQMAARQAELANRIGLPSAMPPAPPAASAGTVEIAVAELAAAAAALAPAGAAAGRPGAEKAGSDDGRGTDRDLAVLVHELFAFLQSPAPGGGWAAAETLLLSVRRAVRQGEAFDYRALGGAPLPVLAGAMSFAALKEFVLLNHDLMFPPFGSPALLHRTARFDGAALGPYFANVARIARKSRDLFELAGIAVAAGAGDEPREVALGRWLMLLSQRLGGGLRDELVDDLGDLGDLAGLNAIYARAVRRPAYRMELHLIMRLRDAALDNGDHDLAARAQATIVRLRPGHMNERVILGSIEATGGLVAAAEQTFLAALDEAPGDSDLLARLTALRARSFAPFEVRTGFGTPSDRAITRALRTRGPTAPQARAARRAAVEL